MNKSLTAKQRAFCREYARCLNGTKAAIRAGYSENAAPVTASRMLKKSNVMAEVEKCRYDIEQEYKRESDELIALLWEGASMDIRDFIEIDKEGNAKLRPPEYWDGRLVKSIRHDRSGKLQLELVSKDRMIELLGKHLGLFKDEPSGSFEEGKRAAAREIEEKADAILKQIQEQHRKKNHTNPKP